MGAAAGVAAPVVWLGGALVLSHIQRRFMDGLGWDVWPSGLALGPHGWGQVVVFLVFAALYVVFALALSRRSRWSRVSLWGGRLFVVLAVLTPLLAFPTDRIGAPVTWHGALHAVGYVALMLSILVAVVALLPGLARRSRRHDWRLAPLALLILPAVSLMPDSGAASSYLFFALPFVPIMALALVMLVAAPLSPALAAPSAHAHRFPRPSVPSRPRREEPTH